MVLTQSLIFGIKIRKNVVTYPFLNAPGLVKKGHLGLKWPKSYLNRVFYRIVIAIYVPTYPPIFGIKIGKIVVTYPFPIVPQIKVS